MGTIGRITVSSTATQNGDRVDIHINVNKKTINSE